ncbi:MAG: nuclear transport factor 2 family protein [Hyphomonadaceae bacterium]|nr:nuclear transport factor 2 family protein [Hyphomonadaceae bacterium]
MADDLAARIERLEAIEEIKQLKARYFRSIDRRDTATLETLFTDDVEIDYEGGTYRWQLQGASALIEALRAAFNPRSVACHTGHTPEIFMKSATEATGHWYLTDVMISREQKLITSGSALYLDTYRKTADGWRIARSTYKRIYEIVEHYEKEPGITYAYLATLDD